MSQSFQDMSILNKTEITPKYQKSASTFCSCEPRGFGYLPMITNFDPTVFLAENEKDSLSFKFIPTEIDVENAIPLNISGELPAFQSRKESSEGGVETITLEALQNFSCFASNGQRSFKSRKLGLGIVETTTYNDIHIFFNGLYITEFENKGAESSLLPAVAQGATSSTNFCLDLYAKGVPKEHCIVPVVSNNGISMCFGATILLDKTFPTYIPLSKQLDLLNKSENKMASAYLKKIKQHAESVSKIKRGKTISVSEMELSLDKYFVKKLKRRVFDRGFGLFTNSGNISDVQCGLNHMLKCLNELYNSEARHIPEYPLSFRTPIDPDDTDDYNSNNSNNYFTLIYRNISNLGYATGTPNRVTNPVLYDIFVCELTKAIDLVHKAGVIHLDLYASNIMWRCKGVDAAADEVVVEIKIVDWDASHCLYEKNYCEKVGDILSARCYNNQPAPFGIEHDLLYLSVYRMEMEVCDYDDWHSLASREKVEIDDAFNRLMQKMRENIEFSNQLI